MSGSKDGQYSAEWERKWWSVEEDRDPTDLPLWQRDYRYGWEVLTRSMIRARKQGEKVFWEVRVLESNSDGCVVEMLTSGLLGFCPRTKEGPKRLAVGDVVKMECTEAPMKRLYKEAKHKPWPDRVYVSNKRRMPIFSHWNFIQMEKNIAKAQELKAGDIVEGQIHKQLPKGLLVELDGSGDGAKGLLSMLDVSRLHCHPTKAAKLFPVGSSIKCLVAHSDKTNGRITLSTKEFEDDDHVGWMLSFPERCYKMAEESVGKFQAKREAHIAYLQR